MHGERMHSNDAVPQAKKAGGLEAVVHRCQVAYTVDVAALLASSELP
jgi:hypothetical protein